MRIRVPPGRAGRQWLRHRIEVATHAADLLEHKRRELAGEIHRLRGLVGRNRTRWEETLVEAKRWIDRVDATGGPRSIRLAAGLDDEVTTVDVRWQSVMGVVYPVDVEATLPEPAAVAGLEGAGALAYAAEAYRRASELGIQLAAAEAAHNRIAAELGRTVRRLRALESRAIPAHEHELAVRELRLEEDEREDLLRARWATEAGAVVSVTGGT